MYAYVNAIVCMCDKMKKRTGLDQNQSSESLRHRFTYCIWRIPQNDVTQSTLPVATIGSLQTKFTIQLAVQVGELTSKR